MTPGQPPGPAATLGRVLHAIAAYLLGFLALTVFAFLAFGGGQPSDDRLLSAFRAAAPIAIAELVFLTCRSAPANRLVLGANLWLIAGGLAVWLQQWWWLRGYQRLGEASLFAVMAAVGVASTALTRAGFVAAVGPRRPVLVASLWLLAAVGLAFLCALHFRGQVRWAAVVPVIALSWLNRWLRHRVAHAARLAVAGDQSAPRSR